MAWILSCIGCGTKKLPQTEEIEVLDFQHYSLGTVPPYVFECERFLEELYLDYNQITELPKELFLCHELQILSLSDNDLHHIPPAISSLSNLTSLDISKNGITDIPDSIKSCKRLRCVNASINPLCKLPEGFTQLVALRELSLSDTFLEYLPANFGRLSGLEVLELRENQLNTLPRSMTRLTALKRLDLGQNEFTELPEVIGHLTSLVDLWIDSNRIKRLPAELGNLSRLSFLDVTKNRLREIDPQIGNCKSLSDLYLTRNDLEELPDSLCQCTKLTYLHIDDNHLEHLPDKLGSLDSLLELKVSKNELSALPNSVGLLRNLQFLHADENVLCSLPGDVGSCVSLVVITASHNRIRELPAEMGSLSALRVLNLCGNAIQSLPVSFTKLQLTALWLSENQAKPSVPLQRMTDESGQKVLTCFMLPQSLTQSPVLPTRADEDRPLTEAEIEARRARSSIHFATDGEQKPPSRLSRTPTPYPKELRALAKHTKNILALKKEKETTAAVAKETDPLMKDAEEVSPKKETNSTSALITVKTSVAAVKVASTVASESAIIKASPPVQEEELPPLPKNVTSPAPEPMHKREKEEIPTLQCQNGPAFEPLPVEELPRSPLSSPTQKEVEKTRTESIDTNSRYIEESQPAAMPKEATKVTTTSVKPSLFGPPAPVAVNLTSRAFPTDSRPDRPEPPPPSLRPASIAVSDFTTGHTSRVNGTTYPMRPGSLALEGAMPPWQKQRPGSLAAPINTVGIPPPDLTQRSSSHSALHSPGGNVREIAGVGFSPQGVPSPGEMWDSSPRGSNRRVGAPSQTWREEKSGGSGAPNAGLVSIINQVTEERLEEDLVGVSPPRTVTPTPLVSRDESLTNSGPKVASPTHSGPMTFSPSNSGPMTFSPINSGPMTFTLSNSGPKDASPTQSRPMTFSPSQSGPMTFSPTQSGSMTFSPINSGPRAISPTNSGPRTASPTNSGPDWDKAGSKIPTFSGRYSTHSSHQSGQPSYLQQKSVEGSHLVREKSPPAFGVTSPTPKVSQIPPPLQKVTSPEGFRPSAISPKGVSKIPSAAPTWKPKSGIPTLASPSDKKETDSEARSPPPSVSHIPSLKIDIQKTRQTPPASNKEVLSPKSPPTRLPTLSQVTSPSSPPPEKESFIPVMRTGSGPRNRDSPMSPVEKPINQTGIPILSPTESNEKTSRIPTFSSSSLRGKSSLPVAQGNKEVKYQATRKYINTSS